MSQQKLDLSKLALNRVPTESPSVQPRRKRWVLRYVLPFSILLGFVALLGAAAGRQLFASHEVTIVPVIVERGDVQQEGMRLFQAAGWIEPRPTAVGVPALAAGVIQELLVVEGQAVDKGQPIARLIAIDAELSVELAKATLEIREAELQRAKAEKAAAIVRLQQPVHLQVQLADAKSLLAKANTQLGKLPFLLETAQANLEFTTSNLEGKQAAKGAIATVVIEQAANSAAAAESELKELKQRGPNLQREVTALQGKVDALQRQLNLLVEENRQLQEATANVASAAAIRNEANLLLRQAKLNLERTVVRAPITGCILKLLASPGARVMGLDQNAAHSSSTVVEMYNPTRLQVRADVRLEDVPMVVPGAPVEIQTASSGKLIKGRVLQSTSSANIQKNTLEVKVELLQPPTTVSPEMLVTATFLAPKTESMSDQLEQVECILVPEQLVRSEDGRSFAWVVDASNVAVKKTVTVGDRGEDGLVEITAGLNVTDKLISSAVENLQSGDPVVVTGEDQTIGMER